LIFDCFAELFIKCKLISFFIMQVLLLCRKHQRHTRLREHVLLEHANGSEEVT
jgi:hypothetical protein